MSFYIGALPVEEIRSILSLRLRPLSAEMSPLTSAFGRISADKIVAIRDVPEFDKSAMDGYAIHPDNLSGGVLEPDGECLIGEAGELTLSPGKTIYVSTGSPVPAGTAAIVPVEQCRIFDGAVIVGESQPEKHVIRKGEHRSKGQVVCDSGFEFDLSNIALLAAQGVDRISVVRRPTVAFFTTGDEISSAGGKFEVLDAITPAIAAWCHMNRLELVQTDHLPDDVDAIASALSVATADLVITSGGASVGRKDFTRKAVAGLAEIIVPGICIKPGSPAFVAVRDRQTFLGLPGNPNAAAYQLDLLGNMILYRLTGR